MNRPLQVNIHEAKTNLSRLIEDVVSGKNSEIIIARDGKPMVRLTTLKTRKIKLGVMNGKYPIPDDIDAGFEAEMAALEKSRIFPASRKRAR